MFDQWHLTGVRKAYILKSHAALHLIQRLSICRILRYRFFVQKMKDSSRTCQRVLKFCHHAGDLVKRLGILIGIIQKTTQLTNGNSSLDRGKCTENTNARIHQSVDKAGGRISNGREEGRFQAAGLQSLVNIIKLFLRLFFIGKCFNHFLVSHHFFYQRSHLCSRLRLQTEHGKCTFCNKVCHEKR